MAFQMPTFLSRFLRPFTSSASISLQPDIMSTLQFPASTQRATFAGGCFWGVEELYRKNFGKGKGLLDCRVGYTGGKMENPDYNTVCSGKTGHAEALLIMFDPDVVSYRSLVEFFFKMHDPTTMNRQGADTGTQYRSGIYTHSDDQLSAAKLIAKKVGKEWYKGKPITTEIVEAGQWYDAESYHQKYLMPEGRGGEYGYHCPAHYVRSFPPLSE